MEQTATEKKQVTRSIQPTQSEPTPNVPRSYPFPTEVISLPSKGLCYPESSPLSKGEITIKLMTAKEEDILTSTNLIRKGIQLDKLLESIVVEPGVNINDILIGDKNAILVTSRILAFGPEYNVTVNDPEEKEPVETVVDLSKIKIKEIDETKLSRNNEYDFMLPVSKIPVKFKLLTHGDEAAINKDIEASQKTLKSGNEITARYRRIITEVEGNRDFGHISNFVANRLLAGDSKALRKYIASLTPDLDLSFEYTSPFTGETEALKIPFGVDFFTLPTNYSVNLHSKIFQMVYYANGGFNWHDLYYMPVKLREFYWRELLKAKEEETKALDKTKKSNSKVIRR